MCVSFALRNAKMRHNHSVNINREMSNELVMSSNYEAQNEASAREIISRIRINSIFCPAFLSLSR